MIFKIRLGQSRMFKLWLIIIATALFSVGARASCAKQLRYPKKVIRSIESLKYFYVVSRVEASLPRNRKEMNIRFGEQSVDDYIDKTMQLIARAYEEINHQLSTIPKEDTFYQPFLNTKISLSYLMGHVWKRLKNKEHLYSPPLHEIINLELIESKIHADKIASLDLVFGLVGSALGALGELKMGLILPGFVAQGLQVYQLVSLEEYQAMKTYFGEDFSEHLLSLEIDLVYEQGKKWGEVKNKNTLVPRNYREMLARAEEIKLLIDFLKSRGRRVKYEYFFSRTSISAKGQNEFARLGMVAYGSYQIDEYISEAKLLLKKH